MELGVLRIARKRRMSNGGCSAGGDDQDAISRIERGREAYLERFEQIMLAMGSGRF